MSSKRKCIVILLFIVIVSILFILYNRSHFFFGIYNHCTYSVYKLHSKSFKNHSDLVVDRLQDRVKFLPNNLITQSYENSLKRQNYIYTLVGMRRPKNFSLHKECPRRRILTVLLTGQLGNVIWEYMSLVAVEALYGERLGTQSLLPGNMKAVLEVVFERIDIPQLLDFPARCFSAKYAQVVERLKSPKTKFGVPNDAPIILDRYSCRHIDILRYGFEHFKQTLTFKKCHLESATKVLLSVKTGFGFHTREEVTFVSVHYRGKDYNESLYKFYPDTFKGPSSVRFYYNAMQYFNRTMKNVIFLFISIDTVWLHTNTPYLKGFRVAVNPYHGAYPMANDFILLSTCNNSILNYGTFAAAAAMFAGGTTLVFDVRLPPDGRGYSLASSLTNSLSNWFLCNEEGCFI